MRLPFVKIVPKLKVLGLLTPQGGAAYVKTALLRFGHLSDSAEESEPQPSEEWVKLMMELF